MYSSAHRNRDTYTHMISIMLSCFQPLAGWGGSWVTYSLQHALWHAMPSPPPEPASDCRCSLTLIWIHANTHTHTRTHTHTHTPTHPHTLLMLLFLSFSQITKHAFCIWTPRGARAVSITFGRHVTSGCSEAVACSGSHTRLLNASKNNMSHSELFLTTATEAHSRITRGWPLLSMCMCMCQGVEVRVVMPCHSDRCTLQSLFSFHAVILSRGRFNIRSTWPAAT